MYTILYLGAAVLANLLVTWFGPGAAIWVAFSLIGLDLTSRDKLHDAWRNDKLWLKMTLLIGTGSLLSWFLNRNAGPIAMASFVAFGAAGIADTLVYHILKEKAYLVRINGSNVVSAMVDSLVFPTLAFGSIMPLIILGQFAAKVAGGAIWSLILDHFSTKERIDE
jgi:hypothetical protein